VTGAQILTAFQAIGATVQLTPAGAVDVESPDVPELERLVAEAKANRSDVVAELKRHAAVPNETAAAFRSPGREPERPCLGCLRAECRAGELFHDEACFRRWKAERDERRQRGDTRGAAPVEIASPEPTSRESSAPRGDA
jgi:hypothetical protein